MIMANNPEYPVNVIAGGWVKVATNVTTGNIYKKYANIMV